MDSDKAETNVQTGFFSRWGYFSLIASTILITPIAGLLIYRENQLAGLPDIGHPFDVAAFTSLSIPIEQNAHPDYQRAISLMVSPRAPFGKDEPDLAMDEGWDATSENVRNWVTDNQPALGAWRIGIAKPDIEGLTDFISGLPENSTELRQFYRLATVDARRLEADGKNDDAWKTHHALIRFGRQIGKRGTLVARLVGDAIFQASIVQSAEWISRTSLDEQQLRLALRDVVSAGQIRASIEETAQWEYVVTLNLTKWYYPHGLDWDESWQAFVQHEPELGLRVLQHDTAIELARIRSTTPPATVLSEADLKRFADRTANGRRMRDMLLHLQNVEKREAAAQRSLEAFLAAAIFRRKHGEFLKDWAQVIPILKEYGAEKPVDPYSPTGELFRFRVDGNRLILWSLGRNEVDDSGNPSLDQVLTDELRRAAKK